MTPKEVARKTGWSERTIRNWLKMDKYKKHYLKSEGGHYWVKKSILKKIPLKH